MTTENTNRGGHPHGDEIDLVELAQKVWAKRKMILRNTAIGAVVGIVVAFSIPKEYKTTVKLAPENSIKSNNMGSLAAIAGLSFNSSESDGLSPTLYPDVISSTPFLLDLKNEIVVEYNSLDSISLKEYFLYRQDAPWWSYFIKAPSFLFSKLNADRVNIKEVVSSENSMIFSDETRSYINSIASKIDVFVDKKNGVILISTICQDPVIGATLANLVVTHLEKYMTNYKTEKARIDMNYALRIFEEAKNAYYIKQKLFAEYVDANKNIISASYAVEISRLQNEVDLAFSVYTSSAQQLELAKAKVQQDTPIITVLEPATVNFNVIKPRKLFTIISFSVFSCFISIFIIIVKQLKIRK